MAGSPTFPRVHAMVVCDEIFIREGETGVYELMGVRTQLLVPSFPHLQPLLCVYTQVSGREGTAPCHVEIVRAGEDHPILTTPEQNVPLEGPLAIVIVNWWIEYCSFPGPGLYYVQLYFGTKLLNERLFVVAELEEAENGPEAT